VCTFTEYSDDCNQPLSAAVLLAAMKSLGAATASIVHRSTRLRLEAIQHYSASVAKVNDGLTSPEIAQSDSMLQAIMVLSCFDVIVRGTALAPLNLSSHIHGLAALLDIRGKNQLRTAQGRMLFLQATVPLFSWSLRNACPMPDIVQSLTGLAEPHFTKASGQDLAFAAHKFRMAIANFYSDIVRDRQVDFVGSVRRLMLLDGEIALIIGNSLVENNYLLPYVPPEKDTNTHTTTVQNFQEGAAYQSFRAYSIIIHLMNINLVHQNLASSLPCTTIDATATLKSSKIMIERQQNAILATLPRLIAYVVENRSSDLSTTDANGMRLLAPPLGISHADSTAAMIALVTSLTGNKILMKNRMPD